jgi:predicted small lipoprotein YifL
MSRAALLIAAALLTACGQKGDLYLPAAEREPVLTVPAEAPAPAAPADAGDEEETTDPNAGAGRQ